MATDSKTSDSKNPTSEKAKERIVLLLDPCEEDLTRSSEFITSQSPLYDVDTARTGKDALDLFSSRKYDAVVMSYQIEDMNADSVIREILTANPNCPIVVTTSNDSPELAIKVLRAGAMDYLPKFGQYEKFLPRTITTNLQRSILMENLRDMYRRVERASLDEALLNRLIVNIHGSLELADTLERSTKSLQEEFNVSRVIICLNEEDRSDMKIRRQISSKEAKPISDKSILFEKYHDLLLDIGERRPLVVMLDDTFSFAQDVRVEMLNYDILSMLMVPLVYRGKLMGLIHLDQVESTRLWSVAEINLLTKIANQLAIALSQAKLYGIVEAQSSSISKLTELCSQLNEVVNSTKELTERTESREKVRVKLSTRELEVLKKVAQGLTNKQIAEELHITEGTTEVHVSRLRKKLAVNSRAALVRFAYENHLL